MAMNRTQFKRAGAALRAWRERGGHGAASVVADRFGALPQVWSRWEHGEQRPSLASALRLDVFTSGAVRFESWGHDNRVIAQIAEIVTQRAAPAVVTA